jgi:hypothetical protein
MKDNKELVAGDKITSFEQLKEGMIISFDAIKVTVENAIVIKHSETWFAIHNDKHVDGQRPVNGYCIAFGKEFSWNLGNDEQGSPDDFGEDYSNVIFHGMLAGNEQITKLINIAKNYEAFGKDEKSEIIKHISKHAPDSIPISSMSSFSPPKKEIIQDSIPISSMSSFSPVKELNPYKIGALVKDHCDGAKTEVIGIYEDMLWLKVVNYSYSFRQRDISEVSPWVDPLKYKKGDLVFLLPPAFQATTLYVIDEVTDNGYLLQPINALMETNSVIDCTFDDKDILRKVGVATS